MKVKSAGYDSQLLYFQMLMHGFKSLFLIT